MPSYSNKHIHSKNASDHKPYHVSAGAVAIWGQAISIVIQSHYAALPRGRIKNCTPSVCPSVPCLRFSINGKVVETSNLVKKYLWTILNSKAGLKVKVTGNEKVKIVFHAYLRQQWIDLHQTKTRMITGPFYTYRYSLNTFHQRKCFVFVTFVCNYLGGLCVVVATWPCPYLLLWRHSTVFHIQFLIFVCFSL